MQSVFTIELQSYKVQHKTCANTSNGVHSACSTSSCYSSIGSVLNYAHRPNSGQLIYYNMKGFLCSIDAPLIMSTCGDRQSALKSLITTCGDSLSAFKSLVTIFKSLITTF